MKKVIICASISAAADVLAARDKLEEKGYEVEIPEGVKHLKDWEGSRASLEEKRSERSSTI